MMTTRSAAFLAAAAVAAAACKDHGGELLPPRTVAVVTVEPASADLTVGDTLRLRARVLGSDGSTLTDRPVAWLSSDTTRARVSTAGLVTALAAGDATISATVEGRTGSAHLHIVAAPPSNAVQWEAAADTLAADPGIILAFNSTAVAARDDQGTLHAIWTDGARVLHGRRAAGASAWSKQPIPVSAGAQVRKPTIAYIGGTELVAAWVETTAASAAIRAARSRDRGASWDPAITIAAGPFEGVVSLYAFRRADGSAGAVLAWYNQSLGRVVGSAWRGGAWSAADWTAPEPLSDGTSGTSHDGAVGGRGATVFATWEDTRAGGPPEIYLVKSTDGGITWGSDYPLVVTGAAGAVRGGDPAVAVAGDGTVWLAYQAMNRVFVTSSADGGATFGPIRELGPGLFAHVAVNEDGAVAVSWEHFTGSLFDDSQKRIGLALLLPPATAFDGPHALPGSATHTGDVQAAVVLSDAWIDVFWIDVANGTRTLVHRAGRLP